jgi:hypothetical protein
MVFSFLFIFTLVKLQSRYIGIGRVDISFLFFVASYGSWKAGLGLGLLRWYGRLMKISLQPFSLLWQRFLNKHGCIAK